MYLIKITLQETKSNQQHLLLMCLNIQTEARIISQKGIRQSRNISFAANFIRNILLIRKIGHGHLKALPPAYIGKEKEDIWLRFSP